MNEMFDQIERYRMYLLNEEKATATVKKYIRDITACHPLLFNFDSYHLEFPFATYKLNFTADCIELKWYLSAVHFKKL